MNYTDDARNMLERYLWEVEKLLPLMKRRDLIREMTSNLLDMLESRSSSEEITKEQMTEFLQEHGSPRQIARAYHRPEPLISQEFFPLFKLILTITTAVLGGLFLFRLLISIFQGEGTAILPLVGELFSGLTSLLGALVITFYLLQRFIPSWKIADDEPWDAASLEPLEHRKPPKRIESILSILLSAVFILILTLFRHRLTFCIDPSGLCLRVPVLGPGFLALIPLIVIRLAAGMVHSLILAVKARWSEPLRIGELALTFTDIGIIILLLQGPPDKFFRFDLMEELEQFASVAPILRWVYTGILLLILVLTSLEVISSIRQMISRPANRLPV